MGSTKPLWSQRRPSVDSSSGVLTYIAEITNLKTEKNNLMQNGNYFSYERGKFIKEQLKTNCSLSVPFEKTNFTIYVTSSQM